MPIKIFKNTKVLISKVGMSISLRLVYNLLVLYPSLLHVLVPDHLMC